MEPVIVYEDEDVIAINKPSGWLVHPTQHSAEPTLLDWIKNKHPQAVLVHRLDRETSGLVLAAKHEQAFGFLKEQFKNHRVKKIYHLIATGRLPAPVGSIDWPIARSRTNQTRRVARPPAAKREEKKRTATTNWRVLKEADSYSYVEVSPITGRNHQIRAHFLALGCPILCDKLYGGKYRPCLPRLSRLALHAKRLEFLLPGGSRIKLETDLPNDFKQALVELNLA